MQRIKVLNKSKEPVNRTSYKYQNGKKRTKNRRRHHKHNHKNIKYNAPTNVFESKEKKKRTQQQQQQSKNKTKRKITLYWDECIEQNMPNYLVKISNIIDGSLKIGKNITFLMIFFRFGIFVQSGRV